ncbi:hypothetical protein DPMN_142080 [Dreissena polymorpha]|uniref:C-type lectin domain-containing protein n=1 Tax=Dreissena polymorpha TaxID=45954 RepID=A0A9D4GEQ7_DREPO|nr:hypothetical protein DPMN_142080 [Dreissena polymorpha]
MYMDINFLTAFNLVAVKEFWLGVEETSVTGNFMRIHDEADVSYFEWASGQPDNRGGDQKCVVSNGDQQWAWSDWFCSIEQLVVCELPN